MSESEMFFAPEPGMCKHKIVDGECVHCHKSASTCVDELVRGVNKLEAELAARDAKSCKTCWYCCDLDGEWQCVLPDGLASICAPNNFAEWQPKEEI